MEQVVERSNMQKAYSQVMRNRGAPGVDGLRCEDLRAWLQSHWQSVKAALLDGTYLPRAVRRVDIPKPQGGVRTLGVPTVVDRLIQQALHQVMQPLFEPTFSDGSYGFRPGRSATQAVVQAATYIRGGKRWVVDMDLEKFFDRANHDVLMHRVARRIDDRGWVNYFGAFYKSALYPTLRHLDRKLVLWATRKYKRLRGHRRRAAHWLARIARDKPGLFAHWRLLWGQGRMGRVG